MLRTVLVLALILSFVVPPDIVAAETNGQTIRKQALKYSKSGKPVVVVLNTGGKTSGTIRSVDDDTMVVAESKTGTTQTLRYEDVRQIKRKGLHPAVWAAIAGGALLGAVGIACAANLCGD